MNTVKVLKNNIEDDKELLIYAKNYPKSYKIYVDIIRHNRSSLVKIHMLRVLHEELLSYFVKTGEEFCKLNSLKLCHAKSYLGNCTRNDKYETCKINISEHMFMIGFIPIVNVMAHEMIHSIKNFPRGHKAPFIEMMNKLNHLFGLHIQKKGAYKCIGHYEVHKQEKKPKYILICKHCGHKYFYYRKSKVIKNYRRCYCHICKSDLILKEY